MKRKNKEYFMKQALKEAQKAYDKYEIPVGTVIVKNEKIIARAHNLKETNKNATHHAEILAINKANKKLDNWRLTNCDMYVTLEPCAMCMGAIISSRIKKLYIGAMDEKAGACGSVIDLTQYSLNHKVEIETGILQNESEYILNDFFKYLRNKSGGMYDTKRKNI
jgi:tRNA(adenine34) deaminase